MCVKIVLIHSLEPDDPQLEQPDELPFELPELQSEHPQSEELLVSVITIVLPPPPLLLPPRRPPLRNNG